MKFVVFASFFCEYAYMYAPRNVLVTGGAGFIGSHVVDRLVSNYPQYRIVVFDKMDYCSSPMNVAENVKLVRGDIRSADLVRYVLESENIDTVLHFAAQTHVDNSFGNSIEFSLNNAIGTHVLLEACRVWGRIRRFVNVSTDEVYGESSLMSESGLNEKSAMYPTNPYSAAKASAEMIASGYFYSYGIPIITTRGNNVYGPRQFPEKLVPKAVCLLASGGKFPIHGDGGALRSFIHVRDVASAFDTILHKGQVGEVYNIGTDEERTVLSVVQDIAKEMGLVPEASVQHVADRAFNDQRYFITAEKLEGLGWTREVAWKDGLGETVAWYSDHANLKTWWDEAELGHAFKPHPDRKLSQ